MEDKNQIIEGVFDGQNMTGDDQNTYPVPPNYASKSKLIAGDRLKLTIQEDGSFLFKQIGPISRQRIIASIKKEDDNFFAEIGENKYRILLATATYFKLEDGDKVVAVVPKDSETDVKWAAIENKIYD